MKKLVLLFSVMSVIIIMMVSTSAVAQKSTILVGDKNLAEVSKSAKVIASQITLLKNQIKDLERKNKTEVASLERSIKILLHNPGANQYMIERNDTWIKKCNAKTDSLIYIYEQKKSDLEDQLIAFTLTAAGKDQQNSATLKSRNVNALAEAYMTVKYADNMSANTNGQNTFSADSARIENNWYNPAYVTVKGPAGFHTSFTLGSKKYTVLPIFAPGRYTIFYTVGNFTKSVNKIFDVRNTDFDSKTGTRYAFLSELPAR